MPVKVSANIAHICNRIRNGKKQAAMAVATQIKDDSEQFVPKDQSTLRSNARAERTDKGAAAVWDTPYAAYQYYGCWPDGSHKIKHHAEARTSTQWVKKAEKKYGSDWNKVAQNALKEGMG